MNNHKCFYIAVVTLCALLSTSEVRALEADHFTYTHLELADGRRGWIAAKDIERI